MVSLSWARCPSRVSRPCGEPKPPLKSALFPPSFAFLSHTPPLLLTVLSPSWPKYAAPPAIIWATRAHSAMLVAATILPTTPARSTSSERKPPSSKTCSTQSPTQSSRTSTLSTVPQDKTPKINIHAYFPSLLVLAVYLGYLY